jgi:hypothetical protein
LHVGFEGVVVHGGDDDWVPAPVNSEQGSQLTVSLFLIIINSSELHFIQISYNNSNKRLRAIRMK